MADVVTGRSERRSRRAATAAAAETASAAPAAVRERGVTFRSLVIATGLSAASCYWVLETEGVWHSNHATAMSLFWNTVFFLFLLVVLNVFVLKRYAPGKALTQGELVTIYATLTIATALAGHDSLQLGIPGVAGFPVWYQSQQPSLGWDKFTMWYPDWAMVKDQTVLRVFYEGLGVRHLYGGGQWRFWVGPVLWWSAFIVALGTVMISLNVFIRKQWMDNERLSYPIVQLPMAMAEGGGTLAFFRQKPFWLGFALAAALDLYNGVATLAPSLPLVNLRHDYAPHQLGQYFTAYPWNAVGSIPLPLYPFIVALGYFLPLDLSFSLWFFYLAKKALLVYGAASGIEPVGSHSFPYLTEQSFGAWFVIFGVAVYMARGHLRDVWRRIVRNAPDVDDSREPMSYRTAFAALAASGVFLVYFCLKAGMSLGVVLAFFGIYYVLSVGITRIRAELGPPAHEMAGDMNSPFLLTMVAGSAGVGYQNMAMFAMFWWFTGRGYRTHPMPCQLEAFKMGQQGGGQLRGLGVAMVYALLIGGILSFWAGIHLHYNAGVNVMTAHNWGQFQWVKSQMDAPQVVSRNMGGIYATGFGALAALGMMWMRTRFLWWPFHPAGYAISLTYGAEYYWSCLVLSTLIKACVLRYGGYRLNRRMMPFMFGVILGEYLVGAGWSLTSVLLNTGRVINVHTYDFAPG